MGVSSKTTKNDRRVFGTIALIVGGTFFLDCLTPKGYVEWLLYLAAVFLTSLAAPPRLGYVVASICTFLIAVGNWLSPPGIDFSVSIVNRLLGISSLWMVAVLMERGRRADQLLRESEERYRSLTTATSYVVYRMNPDWSEMRQLHGANFIADTDAPDPNWLAKYIPPDEQPDVMAAINVAIRTKSTFAMEHRVLKVDGSQGWTLSRAIPLLDAQGEINEWFGAASDITERKRIEEALQQSEERYQTLFNTMKEGFFILEVIFDADNNAIDGRIEELNAAFAAHTGWHGALGKRVRDIDPDIEQHWFEMYGKVALTGEPARFVGWAKSLKGWFEVSAYRVGEPGRPKVAILFDNITERKQAEESLKQLNVSLAEQTVELTEKIEQLKFETAERVKAMDALYQKDQMLLQQSRLAAMGEMIGNIAHQWRQPLNVLGLTIQRLKTYYKVGHFSEEILEETISGSMAIIQHMSKTIDDFRNFFRPDKEKREFDVHETIVSTLALLNASLAAKNIAVEVKVVGEPIIDGYHNEFAQVLLNIIKNAVDVFSERNISDPKITISVGSQDGRCIITITDNAGGISEQIIDKIFDPYFTTKGPQQGTGIGLYMSKTIIEKNMGGTLTVCNIAEGARFRIEV